MPDQTPEPAVHDPFLVALQRSLRPEVLDDAGDLLGELIEAVNAHGKKGSLTLTITLDPHERVARAVEVIGTVKSKPPAPEPWASLADCESGEWAGDGTPHDGTATWDATAGIHEGGLQFAPATWDWLRDDDMPDHAYDATPRQQVEVAERVLARQGWRAWPVCSRKLGLRP